MAKKTDRRIIKTEQAIKTVFIELMTEQGFTKVTVKQIIERAKINRGTFYLHYLDKYDLLDKVEEELLQDLAAIGRDAPVDAIIAQNGDTEAIAAYFSRFTSYIHEKSTLFILLIGDKGDPSFLSKLSAMIRSLWQDRAALKQLSIPQNYVFAALIGMVTSLIAEWVNSAFQETPEAFSQIIAAIVKGIPQNIFSDK